MKFIADNLVIRNNLIYGNYNVAIAIPPGMPGLSIDHNGIDSIGAAPTLGPSLTPGDYIALNPEPGE